MNRRKSILKELKQQIKQDGLTADIRLLMTILPHLTTVQQWNTLAVCRWIPTGPQSHQGRRTWYPRPETRALAEAIRQAG